MSRDNLTVPVPIGIVATALLFACLLTFPAPSAARAQGCLDGGLGSSLIHWWPLDEGSDITPSDVVGRAHGTIIGNPESCVGPVSLALDFDGNDAVVVPPTGNLNISGDVTAAAWYMRRTFNTEDYVVTKGATTRAGVDVPTSYGIFLNTTGEIVGWFEKTTLENVYVTAAAPPDTLWHHVAYVREGHQHRIYLDGVLVGTAAFSGRPGNTANLPLTIGALDNDGPYVSCMDGKIDEVVVFNRALEADDIAALYAADGQGVCHDGLFSDLLFTFDGEAEADRLGRSLGCAGDVNGDGYDDFIVAGYLNDGAGTDAGRAYLFYGGPNLDSTPDLVMSGNTPGEQFGGLSAATAGDVNGDGFADVVVGAWTSNAAGAESGRAYVFYGGLVPDAVADLVLTGETAGDRFGVSAGTAGDINGDGYDDLIVGAYMNDGNGADAGRAYVYYGGASPDASPDLVMTGEAAGDRFGRSVGTAGDINRDGFADVIVGGLYNDSGGIDAGRAYIYLGGTAPDAVPDILITGDSAGGLFGFPVGPAGDVNGDGYDDVIVAAAYHDAVGIDTGRVYVFLGAASFDVNPDLIMTGEAPGDIFGFCSGAAGDVNGDGYDDMMVGAYRTDAGTDDTGRVYVYFGGPIPDGIPDLIFTGEATDDEFGSAVSTACDLTGDGYSDIIIGAWQHDTRGNNNGRAYVYNNIVIRSATATLTGGVTADCPVPGAGLLGVTVDLFDADTGDLVASDTTDAEGAFAFPDVAVGAYAVSIVGPLGYTNTAGNPIVILTSGDTQTVEFSLSCLPIEPTTQGSGFWKHQVGVATGGKGGAQLDGAAICEYLDLVQAHFNNNAINQVVVYDPPGSGLCEDKLAVAKDLLNLKGNVGMTARAKQNLMGLLLNVAASYVSLAAPASDDGATVSQAITYCDNLIDDPAGDHETAKDIAECINDGVPVRAGVIPLDTANIAYRRPHLLAMQNYPNPFGSRTVIRFALPAGTEYSVLVFNVAGERLCRYDGSAENGEVALFWDARDESGRRVAPGVYFYQVRAAGLRETRKMMVLK